ncbi:MAG: tetratricopeptide repeat protein [bacterium]|nr:tetratricopeptide repeat protein [bacterium]
MSHSVAASVVLVLLGLGIYWQVGGHEFVRFDDPTYISENAAVQEGLTWAGIRKAFVGVHGDNWMPITALSHMLDGTLFGIDPGPHQQVNALLHILAGLLLFFTLRNMTGSPGASLFVAALFVAHPLHVESVAWASERKDVLSALFWILTLLAYVHYSRAPSILRYTGVFIAFALGLMSKPMGVTLPFVLLLLDRWPLRRWTTGWPESRLLLEKLILLPLVAGCAYITLRVQSESGAMHIGHLLPLSERLLNASIAYLAYLGKSVWPTSLSVFYPHQALLAPEESRLVSSLLASFVLAATSALVWRVRETRPHLLVGWLWFLGTLVPVIGLIQVGEQSMADRYSYLPGVGLYVMLAWSAPVLRPAWVVPGIASLWIAALALVSFAQVGTWRTSETLFANAVRADEQNYLAHNNLGNLDFRKGRVSEAILHYERAVASWPDYELGHFNLANALLESAERARAEHHLKRVLELNSDHLSARISLAILAAEAGDYPRAEEALREAAQAFPESFEAHFNLAGVYLALEKPGAAAQSLERALEIQPGDAQARKVLEQARAAAQARDR